MLKQFRFRTLCALVVVGVIVYSDAPLLRVDSSNVAYAQGGRGGRNWGGQQGQDGGGQQGGPGGRNWGGPQGQGGGGQQGGPGGRNWGGPQGQGGGQQGGPGGRNWGGQQGQGGGQQGGPGGRNRGGQGGPGGFSPEQIVSNMTSERFERLRNSPMAERIKEQVGNDRWAQWERGDFTASVSAAEQAAAAAEGRPLDTEMTEEERRQAEELLHSGTVPVFSSGRPYSLDAENDYMREALAHRDDTLVPAIPVSIRFYCKYFLSKYDKNGNGRLEQEEWVDRIPGAQAIDLDRDWVLTDQEIMYYLAGFAKNRTIANPRPAEPQRTNLVVEKQEQPLLIRTMSAAPRLVSQQEADKERATSDVNIDQLSDEEFMALLTGDNPALESVDDEELLDVLLTDMDESSVREYAAAPQDLIGVPVWFLARDTNGDGQLSLREFAPNLTAAGVAQFGKLDLNADGFITAEEIRKSTQKQ